MENKVLEKDLDELISQKKYFDPLKNSIVLVTGCTGLIGSIIVKALIKYGNIKVYACCRNENKFNSIFQDYICDDLIPVFSDILQLDISTLDIDYIIHGASITDSKTFIKKPVETIEIAFEGTKRILKQCINKRIKGFVYLSSLEVYGTFKDFDGIKNVTEKESGYIDILSVRSSYSEGKRMVENLCKAFQSEYKVPVKICRLSQTFGAGVDYNDNRVFAQFVRSIIEGKDIILKTKGETVRNYCYTTDAVSGILTVLIWGIIGEAYNVANIETTISIAKMAELVCGLPKDYKCKVIFDITEDVCKLGYNPTVKIQLDSGKLNNLGWKPKITLSEMYRRLLASFEN